MFFVLIRCGHLALEYDGGLRGEGSECMVEVCNRHGYLSVEVGLGFRGCCLGFMV